MRSANELHGGQIWPGDEPAIAGVTRWACYVGLCVMTIGDKD